MGIFGIFNRDRKPYSQRHLNRADLLIKSATVYDTSMYAPLLNQHPELESIAQSSLLPFWDPLISMACVGTAFMEITDSIPDNEQRGTCFAIQKILDEQESKSYDAMENFVLYVKKLVDSGIEIPDAIGGWVWINLEKHPKSNPKLQELASSLKLVRVIGLQILLTFHDWWKRR